MAKAPGAGNRLTLLAYCTGKRRCPMPTNSLAMYQLIALCDAGAHQAPMLPFTVAQAHGIMQIHVACRAKQCPRKAAALQVLVEAGRMVLAPNRMR